MLGFTVISFQEQRVILLLSWIKERSIKQISGSERNNFLYMERNDHGTKRCLPMLDSPFALKLVLLS